VNTADEHAEPKARTAKIQADLDRLGCDALFITSEDNFRYLTGLHGPVWHNLTRPRYLIVPRKGDPILISTSNHVVIAEETSWITDIRTWVGPNPEDDGISLVIDAVRACLGNGMKLAAELGPQSRLSMPCGDFLRIRNAFADLEVIDGHGLIMALRMVKSTNEIERIRKAALAASRAFEQLPDFSAGLPDLHAISQQLKIRILGAGAEDVPYVVAARGKGGYPCVNLAPSHEKLEAGDVFVIDVGARCEGYHCDFDRDFAVGEASSEVRQSYQRVWAATEAGLAAVKPGVRLCDVWRAMAEELGLEDVRSTGIGRMGHSIGLRMCEEPSVSEADQTVIQENMVLTLEPGIVLEPARNRQRDKKIVVHEENLVVTANGADLLSLRAPRDIPIVAV
jgi:Xaa-Pro aminopeptidase